MKNQEVCIYSIGDLAKKAEVLISVFWKRR